MALPWILSYAEEMLRGFMCSLGEGGAGTHAYIGKSMQTLCFSQTVMECVIVSAWMNGIRVSPHFYNTEDELERLVKEAKRLR